MHSSDLEMKGRIRLSHAPSVQGLVVLLAVVGTGSLGCASVKPTQTGYLSDYSQLKKSKAFLNWGLGYHRFSRREPTSLEMVGINSFYIEPVAWLALEDDWLGPNQDRQERVSAALDAKLRKQFGEIRPIVATPGPNTATIHSAVTGVNSARTILNILATIIYGPISNGGASIEAEVLRPGGEQVAAISGSSHGGSLDIFGYYIRSDHAKTSVRRLAGDLANGVEQADCPIESAK